MCTTPPLRAMPPEYRSDGTRGSRENDILKWGRRIKSAPLLLLPATAVAAPVLWLLPRFAPSDAAECLTADISSPSFDLPQAFRLRGRRPRNPSSAVHGRLHRGKIKLRNQKTGRTARFFKRRIYKAAFAFSTRAVKAALSWMAISESILRFKGTSAFLSPFMKRE